MDASAIKSELYAALDRPNGLQAIQHLVRKLRKCEGKELSASLLGVFEDDRSLRSGAQDAAGGILWYLKPAYEGDLTSDLERLIPNWDVSVEELPWYLAEVNGVEVVRDATKAALSRIQDEGATKRFETVLWWLSHSDPMKFREDLNNRWRGRLKG